MMTELESLSKKKSRRSTLGVGLLVGLVASLLMTALLLAFRYVFGVATPSELVGDRIAPLLSVDQFIKLLGRFGGYNNLKQIDVLSVIGGQLVVGALGGLLYAVVVARRGTIQERTGSHGHITKWATPLLVVFGCASFLLYRVSLRAKGGDDIDWFIKVAVCQSIIYLLSAWIVVHARSSRSTLVIVIVFAALFRLSILFAPPYLSDDIYRYIWDGRTQAAGINPYQYIPADKALAPLRDETIYSKINRREYAHTIYPPGAQMIYFLATQISERVTWMKTVMVGFEALAIWALFQLLASFKLPGQHVLIFAWHPLLVWEIAGSGHVEAAAIACIVLALLARRHRWDAATGAALAGATLIKLFPIILLPAMYRRWGWKMPVTFLLIIVIAYLPYLGVGGKAVLGFLPAYAWEEGLQSGAQFYLLGLARRLLGEGNVPTVFYFMSAILILGTIAVWTIWKRDRDDTGYIGSALVLSTTFTVLLAPRYPWYFAWLVAFACLRPLPPLFYLTTACFVLYNLWHPAGPGRLLLLNTIIYVPFALLGLIPFFKRLARKGRRLDERSPLADEPA